MFPTLVDTQRNLVFVKSVAELALPCFILREVFEADMTTGAVFPDTFKLTQITLKLSIFKRSYIILLFSCKVQLMHNSTPANQILS